jgi:hypothetical protein
LASRRNPRSQDDTLDPEAATGNLPDAPPQGDGTLTGGANTTPAPPSIEGRSGETPRDRVETPGGFGGNESTPNIQATMRRPTTPTPMAGTTFEPSAGVLPFQPMGAPDMGALATPHLRPLYGRSGGLQGGGLGVALDTTPNSPNQGIGGLIQALLGKKPGLF